MLTTVVNVSLAQRTRGPIGQRAADVLLALAIWLGVLWGVGAQWWTGMNAPDSQFSASLAIFGNQVNERALDPSYYWTRLGYLGPVHWLVESFGIWNGFAIWRAFILLLIVSCVYWTARQFAGHAIASMLTLLVALNSMVLGYLGNPYATGTAMAAAVLLFALAIALFRQTAASPDRRLWLLSLGTGAALAWLLMLNPYNALLAGVTWLGIRAVGWWLTRPSLGALA